MSSIKHLLLVFAAASLIWLPSLGTVPHWHWDEGVNLNYASNLAEGRLRWFTLEYAFIPHPPLYIISLAALVKVFGESIIVSRLFSVALNYGIIYLMYLIGGEVGGRRTGVYSAAAYAAYPAAVYWGRMGFSNNFLSILVVASMYSMIKYVKVGGRWWVPCCLLAGLSAVTEPQGLLVAAALGLYFMVMERSRMPQVAALIFGPFLLFATSMTFVSQYFMEDVMFQVQRVGLFRPQFLIALPILAAAAWKRRQVVEFLSRLLSSEVENIFETRELFKLFWVPAALLAAHFITSLTMLQPLSDRELFVGGDYYWLGIVGLLFLPAVHRVPVTLVFFLPSFLSVLVFGRSDHMLIPMYPFFALGVITLLEQLYKHLKPKAGFITALLLLSYPLAFAYLGNLQAYAAGGVLGEQNPMDVEAVAAYVASDSKPGGLVLTMSPLVPYFGNATIITQSVVYEGYAVDYYHGKYPPERYAFNCSYRNADYLVIPNGTLEWVADYASEPAGEMLSWPVVNGSGAYLVYRNPSPG